MKCSNCRKRIGFFDKWWTVEKAWGRVVFWSQMLKERYCSAKCLTEAVVKEGIAE